MIHPHSDKSWNFLIATPEIDSPMFEESVILLLEDNPDGAFGVVLNKPTNNVLSEIDDHFKDNKYLSNAEVFDGGPLAKDRLSIAILCPNENGISTLDFGISPEKAEEILSQNSEAEIFVFLGYSAWSKDQLEDEIAEGTWVTMPADFNLLEELEIEDFWAELLVRTNPIYKKFPKPPDADLSKN